MTLVSIPNQNPRRTPRQRRSSATVDVILEATIQVLLCTGTSQVTTTLVAERAGVSVGSLYQYFPNKQALFFALNDRYLDRLAERIEELCLTLHGAPYASMAEGIISEYIKIKTERYDLTCALYRAAADIDVSKIVEIMCRRIEVASETMFATASDAKFHNLSSLNVTLMNVLFGTVRTFFNRNSPELLNSQLQEQLIIMFCTYLRGSTRPDQPI
ncbi:TetR/AcrR family transcriptional regulator [Acerihabitans sp. TG2]|uniref:TetR/AcrR family transcriptional regulator n=1 Tax=Acerihabitans sp. TG2 TaxID=3096008 RepID=UPI002B23A95C|nr:TetR/AcrR family transcriptional regulator [Acerihabitans sp. TG2]MEA9390255.1 TetR/AcrR family transcriptional regulator [Acerihabitans sp. TG2]